MRFIKNSSHRHTNNGTAITGTAVSASGFGALVRGSSGWNPDISVEGILSSIKLSGKCAAVALNDFN